MQRLIKVCFYVIILRTATGSVYLLHTEDSSSVEFYDCISHHGFQYCRRPTQIIPLVRHDSSWICHQGNKMHTFSTLYSLNITVSTILHQWKSSLETVELYAEYIKQSPSWRAEHDGWICECQYLQHFGKHCDYAFSWSNSFSAAINHDFSMKFDTIDMYQVFGDILCYETLKCNSGRLCLDWRQICDGIQQCMFGFDEENCDLLEYHECDSDEYRCMNGMCIPEVYFLDGEYDCMDLTDEIGFFNDSQCPFHQVQLDCDDRLCRPNEWSCGDGQCIRNRLAFHHPVSSTIECYSRRDQSYMCETNVLDRLWTLPSGQCIGDEEHEEEIEGERTDMEVCVHFFRCAFSEGTEFTCECKQNPKCIDKMFNPCLLGLVQYPPGSIITPYITLFYRNPRPWGDYTPDIIQFNGSIKCRGYLIHQQINLTTISDWSYQSLEYFLCTQHLKDAKINSGGYDQYCYNHTIEFAEKICPQSGECISPYRIRDGYYNCADKSDEKLNDLVDKTCDKIKRHRFRCSANESTCLPAHHLGDFITDCQNQFDESWAGTGATLSKLACNRESKEDCAMIRQYIEASWTIDYDSIRSVNLTKKLPFRAYCDTFWDLNINQDEDIPLCRDWWKCSPDHWQCRTGQCIRAEWVLDGEWDCADASDEQSLFFQEDEDRSIYRQMADSTALESRFDKYYTGQPLAKLCDPYTEFPCFRLNTPSPWIDVDGNRPCLNMSKLGDNIVDCLGGVDEQNTLEYCEQTTMLGNNFKCLSTDTCIPYMHVCDIRCPNRSDDDLLCAHQNQSPHCSQKGQDYTCFNGQCVKSGWCNQTEDCRYGEDEYLCTKDNQYVTRAEISLFRRKKELSIRYAEQIFRLPPLASDNQMTSPMVNETVVSRQKRSHHSDEQLALVGKHFTCNRGVHVLTWNKSFVCVCPQFYYGDKCQYHHDRVTFIFHLNFSQSSLADTNDTSIVLKLLIVFLYNDQIISTTVVHVRPALEKKTYSKKIVYLIYSRNENSLEEKKTRYFSRTDILHHQPYAIRIEGYDIKTEQKPDIWAVWQYPIRFDYLPSYRFVKVLHHIDFIDEDTSDPCTLNPCDEHQECHRLVNSPLKYVCLCVEGYGGNDCTIEEPLCSTNYCAPDALCKPNYRGSLNDHPQPYCLCPSNRFGSRCYLEYDLCDSNPCQNNGTCFPTSQPDRYFCLCTSHHHGKECESSTTQMELSINQSVEYRAALVQYLKIDFSFLDLILINQHPYYQLPERLFFAHSGRILPEIILVKIYSEMKPSIHVISVQLKTTSINRMTEVSDTNRCPSASTLFRPQEERSPIKYHDLCIRNHTTVCFFDENYLCICDNNHTRVDCFGYDHNLDRCSRCLAGGHCIRGALSKSDDFICLCPQCHYGRLCQFNTEQFSFTLDSLIIHDSLIIKLIYLILAIIITILGGLMNYASFCTFRRPQPRRIGVGNYLLLFAIFSQCSLATLVFKFIHIALGTTYGDIPCKIISYLLSVVTRFTYWLMSWITIERVFFVLFPFDKSLKSPRTALTISFITGCIIAGMHFHELLYYIALQDPNGQILCVISTVTTLLNYDRITILIHYIVPFCIQIISITLLIILTAQSRSTVSRASHRRSFYQQLKRQFYNQRELYLAPMIIILSGLPHIILSFSFACLSLSVWQRHAMLIAYFLSHAPQLLGFILFVIPSSSYSKEFRQTTLAKTYLFQKLSTSVK